MAFITDDDYDVTSRQELMAVIATSTISRQKAELIGQVTMTEWLTRRYDTTAIFSATGDDRNIAVIMYLIDIAIYHLYSKASARVMPEFRKDRYHAAMEWLRLASLGKINPDLPEVIDPDDQDNYTGSVGGNEKRWGDY